MDWNAFYRIVENAQAMPKLDGRSYAMQECGSEVELLAEVLMALDIDVEDHFLEPPFHHSPYFSGSGLRGFQVDRYRLIQEYARGGLGVVYRGADVFDATPVAIKVLPPVDRSRPESLERFGREFTFASKVQHANVVPVLASGDNGRFAWYAMPFIQGHSLAQELILHSTGFPGPLWPNFGDDAYYRQVAQQLAGVADGLQCIHDSGVAHRDIKPHNLLLAQDGSLALTDFGLAATLEETLLSRTWQGTPYYMSPEQASRTTVINQSTDIYSMGVVLYELLTLHRPFDGDSYSEVIERVMEGCPPDLGTVAPRIPSRLMDACKVAMRFNPSERFPTARDLRKALLDYLDS